MEMYAYGMSKDLVRKKEIEKYDFEKNWLDFVL